MEYEVGKYYKVVCMECRYLGKIIFVPIFDLLHKDPQFTHPYHHYHLDGRFVGKKVQSQFSMKGGRTNCAVWTDEPNNKGWIPIRKVIKTLKCKRNEAGLITNHLNKSSRYWKWYDSMIGKSCAGKKCPHLGTEMLERNGKLVCPLHNLVGDIKTELIIPA